MAEILCLLVSVLEAPRVAQVLSFSIYFVHRTAHETLELNDVDKPIATADYYPEKTTGYALQHQFRPILKEGRRLLDAGPKAGETGACMNYPLLLIPCSATQFILAWSRMLTEIQALPRC
jgi:hypothetical protein